MLNVRLLNTLDFYNSVDDVFLLMWKITPQK